MARIEALGEIGDERAIPVVLKALRDTQGDQLSNGGSAAYPFLCAAEAAGKLKARGAEPMLLKHLDDWQVVESLEGIGDPAVVPALEAMIAVRRGPQVEGGVAIIEMNCVASAKIAVATLKEGDPVQRYCELLTDPSLGRWPRCEVVRRLGDRADPWAVPYLVKAVKSDPEGEVASEAITALGAFKYKTAVEGLIECFDADFTGKLCILD